MQTSPFQNNLLRVAKFAAIAAVVMGAFALNKQSEFYSLCFHSRLVDSLEFFSSNTALPNCNHSGFEKEKVPSLGVGLRQKSWTSSIDSLKNYWPSPRNPIQAIIVEEAPFMYSTGTQFILLGGVLAESQWQWQRALMESWLNQTAPEVGDLEKKVLSDFFVAVINDRFQAPSMSDERVLDEAEVALDSLAIDFTDYCLSPFRHPEENENCKANKGRLWQLILARGLWQIYSAANLSERRQLWDWLITEIASGKGKLFSGAPTDDMSWPQLQIKNWTGKVFTGQRLTIEKNRLEKELGFTRIMQPVAAVRAAKLPSDLSFNSPILVEQDSQWFWWRGGHLTNALAPLTPPRHLVNIECRRGFTQDSPAEVSILDVESCDPTQLKGWNDLAAGNVQAFIAFNAEVNLMWLNARAMRQLSLPSSARLSLGKMREMTQWQEDTWDASLRVFRPRAAIDLVLGHRASRKML